MPINTTVINYHTDGTPLELLKRSNRSFVASLHGDALGAFEDLNRLVNITTIGEAKASGGLANNMFRIDMHDTLNGDKEGAKLAARTKTAAKGVFRMTEQSAKQLERFVGRLDKAVDASLQQIERVKDTFDRDLNGRITRLNSDLAALTAAPGGNISYGQTMVPAGTVAGTADHINGRPIEIAQADIAEIVAATGAEKAEHIRALTDKIRAEANQHFTDWVTTRKDFLTEGIDNLRESLGEHKNVLDEVRAKTMEKTGVANKAGKTTADLEKAEAKKAANEAFKDEAKAKPEFEVRNEAGGGMGRKVVGVTEMAAGGVLTFQGAKKIQNGDGGYLQTTAGVIALLDGARRTFTSGVQRVAAQVLETGASHFR